MASDPLFDTGEAAPAPLPPQIAVIAPRLLAMHKMYGVTEGQRCGTCAHMFARHYDKAYWKCRKAKQSKGTGTDWRKSWRACGLWQKEG